MAVVLIRFGIYTHHLLHWAESGTAFLRRSACFWGVFVPQLEKRAFMAIHRSECPTMTAMRALRRIANVEGAAMKLASITELVERLWCAENNEKIVIFCVHRAVASGVAKRLRSSLRLARGVVTDASQEYGSKLETHCNGFNDETKLPGVLVTTDKLAAKSIGLHKACSALIHYELPWSPLRVVQRFGRLWRIKTRHQKRPSRAPQVFHIIHPGSIEEEILHRLERRWGHLSALGLDYLPIEYGLGKRVPKGLVALISCSSSAGAFESPAPPMGRGHRLKSCYANQIYRAK